MSPASVPETGGRTSHSAIIARALEIPAVLSVANSCSALRNGMTVIVDGSKGVVIAEPEGSVVADYQAKAQAFAEEKAALEAFRGQETVTADGIEKIITCNIGSPEDVANALEHDAEAIGLFRSEFLFMDAAELPSEEEQFQAYRKVASALKGAPVIIRTLDVGGDREIPYLHMEKEENPFMGFRAVRYCLENAGTSTRSSSAPCCAPAPLATSSLSPARYLRRGGSRRQGSRRGVQGRARGRGLPVRCQHRGRRHDGDPRCLPRRR